MIAFVEKNEKQIARDLQKIFSAEEIETEALFTTADNHGAAVTKEAVISS